jgi:thymidylate synthase (FAD)
VRGLLKRGHESVIEHASATFWIRTDRGVTHELVRHRLASYSQESTRYCNYCGHGIEVIVPPGLSQKAHRAWRQSMEVAEQAYNAMIDDGMPPQLARSVLPNSLKTEIVTTMNFREWRHFLNLRLVGTTGKPHPQIQQIAGMVAAELCSRVPVIFDAYEEGSAWWGR